MNAAVLMFTACLAGPGQVPAPMPQAYPPPAAYPPPVMVYPGQAYGGSMGGCCGHANVDCCNNDCCLLKKIKDKICCIHIHITCEKSCCEHGPVCPKPCAPACPPKPVCKPCPPPCPPKPVCNPCPPKPVCCEKPKPVCNPCPPKPVCNPCPKPACEKPTCCKVEPVCHAPSSCCWTPGYCLHKCKEKLCGLCDHGGCHGGCGTAATPNACGSTVIAPAPGTVVPAPGTVVPAPAPTPVPPKSMPDVKKVGSNYNLVRPELTPVVGTSPRIIDLSPNPF